MTMDLDQLHTRESCGCPPLGPLEWHVELKDPHMDRAYDYAHAIQVAPLMSVEEHRSRIRRYTTRSGATMAEKEAYRAVQEPPLIIIMRGAPGSGKSTWAARYKSRWPHETVVISATDYFRDTDGQVHFRADQLRKSHNWCYTVCTWLCNLRPPRIIVDNTHTLIWEYMNYYYESIRMAYRCFQQVCTGTWQNRSGVPEAKVYEMRERFEHGTLVPDYQVDEDGL